MFKDLFGKTKSTNDAGSKHTNPLNPALEAMKQVIEAKRKDDPLIGAKIGAKEITQRLISGLKNEKGVHIESLLTALGSLAGYACQSSIREEFIQKKGQPEDQVFAVVSCTNGKTYYFGDLLNKPLIENKYSIWSLAAGAAQQLGAKDIIDVTDIVRHVAETVGSINFGVPRISEDHRPGDTPVNLLKVIWPTLHPLVKQFCENPSEWPIAYGLAIQDVMGMGKDVIDPGLALSIVMECAIPMSKVQL